MLETKTCSTSVMQISHSITSQKCSTNCGGYLVTVMSTHCHVQERSYRSFELCDIVCSHAGSSYQKTYGRKGWTQSTTIIFLYLVAFKWCTVGIPRALKCDKIIFSTILYHHQPELLIHRIDPWLSFFLTLPSNC